MSPKWFTAVFTSELGLLFHLPVFIDIYSLSNDDQPSKHHRPNHTVQLAIAAIRIFVNIIAGMLFAFYGSSDSTPIWIAAWSMIGFSLLLYVFSYKHIMWHAKRRHLKFQKRLFAFTHISLINFFFDIQGRMIPTVKISHAIIFFANIIIAAMAAIIALAVSPIQEAWRCYPIEFFPSIENLKYGLCPPLNQITPICTIPNIICNDHHINQYRYVWDTELHYLLTIVWVIFTIYTSSISPKIEYWNIQTIYLKKNV